jgi:hypothetical protein
MSMLKIEIMKKIAFLLVLISFFACQKEQSFQNTNDLTPVELPQNLIGKWRWVKSVGGFSGNAQVVVDSTKQFVLTMKTNKKYLWCENQDCETGNWVFGSKISSNGRDRDTLLVFEHLKTKKTPFVLSIRNTFIEQDTLLMTFYCNDCINPVFIKMK